MPAIYHSPREGHGASAGAERVLPRVSVQEFRLGELNPDVAEAVYFRTESGNIYRIGKDGKMAGSADESRRWSTVNVNLEAEHGNTIIVGQSFRVSASLDDGERTWRHTTKVTEIVYLAAAGAAGPAALIRPSKPTIVEDFEKKVKIKSVGVPEQ